MDKVLLINQSSGYLVYDFAESLSSHYEVSLIAGGDVALKPFLSKVFSFISYNRSNSLSRLFSWLLFSFRCLIHLLFNPFKYKHIILFSNPPLLVFFLFPWSGRTTYIFFDLYPDAFRSIGNYGFISFLQILWIKLSTPIFSRMNAIVFISDEMKTSFSKSYGFHHLSSFRMPVIPLWADSKVASSFTLPIKSPSDGYLSKSVCFFYSGNFGHTHPLENIASAFSTLSRGFSFQLNLFGSGACFNRVLKISRCVSSITVGSALSHQDYIAHLKHSDVGVICIDAISGHVSLPSKLFAMLVSGLPILAVAPKNSSLAKMVVKYECGIVVQPDDIDDIANAFISLGNNKDLRIQLGKNAFKAASFFSKANADLLFEVITNDKK